MSHEEMIEATRRKLDEIERVLGCETERDLVRALVAALPRCSYGVEFGHGPCHRWTPCASQATQRGPSVMACDEHVAQFGELRWVDLPYAPALRALCERMRTWGEPAAPVAASDGGRG